MEILQVLDRENCGNGFYLIKQIAQYKHCEIRIATMYDCVHDKIQCYYLPYYQATMETKPPCEFSLRKSKRLKSTFEIKVHPENLDVLLDSLTKELIVR